MFNCLKHIKKKKKKKSRLGPRVSIEAEGRKGKKNVFFLERRRKKKEIYLCVSKSMLFHHEGNGCVLCDKLRRKSIFQRRKLSCLCLSIDSLLPTVAPTAHGQRHANKMQIQLEIWFCHLPPSNPTNDSTSCNHVFFNFIFLAV